MVQLFHSAYNLKNSIFLLFWNEIKWNENKPSNLTLKKKKKTIPLTLYGRSFRILSIT